MIYITKLDCSAKTARANHFNQIKASCPPELKILFISKRSKNDLIYYAKIVYYLLTHQGQPIYTRDLSLAILFAFFRRVTCLEIHQIGFIRSQFPHYRFKRLLFHQFLKSKRTSLVVLTTPAKRVIKRFFNLKDNKVRVIPDAGNFFYTDRSPYTRGSEKYIGYTGSFEKGKGGIETLQIASFNKEYKFKTAGQLTSDAQKIIKQLKNVEHEGYLGQRDLEKFLSNSHILIAPASSRVFIGKNDITFYTSPLKIYQYLFYPVPIIITSSQVNKPLIKVPHVYVVSANSPESDCWPKLFSDLFEKYSKISPDKIYDDRRPFMYTWKDRLFDMASRFS